jgi:amino acid transporter
MEAIYSSIPETRNPLKKVLIVTITVLLIGTSFWYLTRKNKRKNESRNLR